MQFLITVNDPENGLGSGTERNLTEQVTHMIDLWDRMPGITARLEVHEEDVYGAEIPALLTGDDWLKARLSQLPNPDGEASPICGDCGEPLTVYGGGDGTGDPVHVFCDICTEAEHPADLTPDWNGETGQHLSCEARELEVARKRLAEEEGSGCASPEDIAFWRSEVRRLGG